MSIIIFTSELSEAGRQLCEIVRQDVPEEELEVCESIEGLLSLIKQPSRRPTIAVLVAATREDLSDLLTLQELPYHLRIILIVPDVERETIANAHKLFPRFLTHVNGDLSVVGAVLRRMMARNARAEQNVGQ